MSLLITLSRPDSALEAFRRNPTDGSLALTDVRPGAEPNVRTCGSSRTEQDYCRNDANISRVKLTCFTTV